MENTYINRKEIVHMNKLTPEQKAVIIDKETEQPFSGKWLYNKDNGKYFCAQCGTELFKSETKFDSECGWPSFFDAKNIKLKKDTSHGMIRTEVICKKCKGHLGHLFDDGPYGKRYCINSVALNFKKEKK